MLVATTLVIHLSATVVAAPPRPTPAPPPGLSWHQAESLRAKVHELERRRRLAKTPKPPKHPPMVVTEDELNSYINLILQPKLPPGLSDVKFALRKGDIDLTARLDLDRVKAVVGTSAWSPLALLSGQVPVEIKGRLKSDARFGTFELDDVRLGPMMIPPALLHQLVASSTRTKRQPQGFDILAPFRLPYGLRRVRVHTGRARLEW
jgi:hypothetical protein